jgi:hypothetical protein
MAKVFKNTFAPHHRNEEFRISGIIAALRCSALHYDDLPPEVQDAVDEEMTRREALPDVDEDEE